MGKCRRRTWLLVLLLSTGLGSTQGASWKIIGWNDLGMHCMDSDYRVFSILPPYNTIHAQLVDASGRLVKNPSGVSVTYEAIADPSGSINTSSEGKTEFWTFVGDFFGVALEPDQGLAGNDMPGPGNQPQPMAFDTGLAMFTAVGIPITPYDDQGHKNYYPMMRLVARNSVGQILATTDIVLPVSDEMDCRGCHGSNTHPAARPLSGWIEDPDSEKDFRLNILRLHDERRGGSVNYRDALTAVGYSSKGLYATVTESGTSVLCATCHGSNALPGTGRNGIPPLTRSMHAYHAEVTDPATGQTLDSSSNRGACYSCHPGSETRCLRGVMGNSVAADGSLVIQCQGCHGSMSQVGSASREGWLSEPTCQNCHTGTAVSNSGKIRFVSALDGTGKPRVAADQTFATNPNTPAVGYSLYRFSKGHGGLQCEACHGSTHAEFPTSHVNDNLQSVRLQGHIGTLGECTACHSSTPSTLNGGPHGMHPVGADWVSRHGDAAEHGSTQCRGCHGIDYRGTELSRAFGDRVLSTEFGTLRLWRGFQVGCYNCHNGPGSESRNNNSAPVVQDVSAQTPSGIPVQIQLRSSDPNGNSVALRIVGQPAGGTVGLVGSQATYFPFPDYSGKDAFTYAAWDGSTNSNLGTVWVQVISSQVNHPPTVNAGTDQQAVSGETVPLNGSATDPEGDPLTYQWTQLSGPTVVIQNPTTAVAGFTAPSTSQAVDLSFNLHVEDDNGGAADDQVTVTVFPIVLSQKAFYFPQIGNGAGESIILLSNIVLVNTGSDTAATLEFFSQGGDPLPLVLQGQGGPKSTWSFNLARGTSLELKTSGTGDLQVGYARVSGGVGLSGTAIFEVKDPATGITLTEAGVPASEALTDFTIFVDSVASRNTGLALINPSPIDPGSAGGAAHLKLRLYNRNFTLLRTVEIDLAEGEHLATFFTELFPDFALASEMQGVLTVESSRGVVAVTIQQEFNPALKFPQYVPTLTIFPVIPNRADVQ